MIVKKHIAEGRRLILAVCDDELLGKKFIENGKQLDANTDFYGGEKMGDAELVKLMGSAYAINALGKDSVACCIKAGVCKEGNIPKIASIPYCQIVLF